MENPILRGKMRKIFTCLIAVALLLGVFCLTSIPADNNSVPAVAVAANADTVSADTVSFEQTAAAAVFAAHRIATGGKTEVAETRFVESAHLFAGYRFQVPKRIPFEFRETYRTPADVAAYNGISFANRTRAEPPV